MARHPRNLLVGINLDKNSKKIFPQTMNTGEIPGRYLMKVERKALEI